MDSSRESATHTPNRAGFNSSSTTSANCVQLAPITVTTTLNDNDVLLGRGTPSAEFEGNLRLRKLVMERRAEYLQCTRRIDKHSIAEEIIDQVHSRGGRFLQRIVTSEEADKFNVPPRTQAWKVIEPSNALFVKVKQLMRDVGQETREKRKSRRIEQRVSKKRALDEPAPRKLTLNLPTSTAPIVGPHAASSNEETVNQATEETRPNPDSQAGQLMNPQLSLNQAAPLALASNPSQPVQQASQLTADLLQVLLQQTQSPNDGLIGMLGMNSNVSTTNQTQPLSPLVAQVVALLLVNLAWNNPPAAPPPPPPPSDPIAALLQNPQFLQLLIQALNPNRG